jgi:hypothetical protein
MTIIDKCQRRSGRCWSSGFVESSRMGDLMDVGEPGERVMLQEPGRGEGGASGAQETVLSIRDSAGIVGEFELVDEAPRLAAVAAFERLAAGVIASGVFCAHLERARACSVDGRFRGCVGEGVADPV